MSCPWSVPHRTHTTQGRRASTQGRHCGVLTPVGTPVDTVGDTRSECPTVRSPDPRDRGSRQRSRGRRGPGPVSTAHRTEPRQGVRGSYIVRATADVSRTSRSHRPTYGDQPRQTGHRSLREYPSVTSGFTGRTDPRLPKGRPSSPFETRDAQLRGNDLCRLPV